jgi:glutamine---fructose-6-phosphate transaminase (isomerizing)
LSENKDSRFGAPTTRGPGDHSLKEILSQPHCWGSCFKELEESRLLDEIWSPLAHATEWLFVGCGSSYYVALAAAATWTAITGRRARAIPASEMLLFPELIMTRAEQTAGVVISRSGRTSEAVEAAQLLEARGVRTLAVTCADGQPLSRMATRTLSLLSADEESTVMTRSFSSMLLALEYLAGSVVGNHTLVENLRRLPELTESVLKKAQSAVSDFVKQTQFDDYICLGQGPFYGLASESALKITEMSVSYSQCFHTLEFRHGPKSVVSPKTLVIFLFSETGHGRERGVLEEIKSLGATTLAVVNQADQRTSGASDLVIELKLEIPEILRLAPYVFAGQLLGLYTGLKKGLDPDNPRHLNRVVMLDEGDPTQEPRHAAL